MSRPLITDEELLSACRLHDRNAQRIVYERYYADMMLVCLRYSADQDDAHDILQNGFLKVFSKIHLFSGDGSLKSWIASIMVHTAIDSIRRRKREKRILEQDYEVAEYQAAEVESSLNVEEILHVVQALPAMQRAVFNLFVMDGQSHREISAALDITEGTSKWYLCEARKFLRQALSRTHKEEVDAYAR